MSDGEPNGTGWTRPIAAARRKPIALDGDEAVRIAPLDQSSDLPLLIQPEVKDVDLIAWAGTRRKPLEDRLSRHGAILFRGFAELAASEFERFIASVADDAIPYVERSSPRSQEQGHIYTSTEYPPRYDIFMHNENSYAQTWPQKLFFMCVKSAEEGGNTPLADVRKVFDRIEPDVRRMFEERGILYVRNFGQGVGLPWETVFQTSDRAEVNAYCEKAGYQVEWHGDSLRTRRIGKAIARHPKTQELVWFNHGTFFHVSTLVDEIRSALLLQFAEEELPNHTFYGDGSTIEPETLDMIRQAYREEMVEFPWQKGDILMIDNMLVAHGRGSFRGERKILVGMSEPMSDTSASD